MLEFFDIPKMKIVMYALTFLGYAYSGYGADVIGHLRDAVLAAETVFGDFLDNFMHVARKFRGVTEVLNAAVDENCQYICPNGLFYFVSLIHSYTCLMLFLEHTICSIPNHRYETNQ